MEKKEFGITSKCFGCRCIGPLFRNHLLNHIDSNELKRIWEWLPSSYRNDADLIFKLQRKGENFVSNCTKKCSF